MLGIQLNRNVLLCHNALAIHEFYLSACCIIKDETSQQGKNDLSEELHWQKKRLETLPRGLTVC